MHRGALSGFGADISTALGLRSALAARNADPQTPRRAVNLGTSNSRYTMPSDVSNGWHGELLTRQALAKNSDFVKKFEERFGLQEGALDHSSA